MSVRARRLAQAGLILLAGMTISGIGSTPVAAQSPAPAPAVPDWVGTWRGPFITDGPSGTMNLVVAHENSEWKIVNDMEGDEVPPKTDVREWKIDGAAFSFAQTFGDYDVFFKGTMEAGSLKGTLEAYQAGSLVGTGSFTLTRQ